MTGSMRDGSFCCLIAIYATHLLLFHLLHEPGVGYATATSQRTDVSNSSSPGTADGGRRHVYVSYGSVAEMRRRDEASFNKSKESVEGDERTRSGDEEEEIGATMRYQMFTREQQQPRHTNWESSMIDRPAMASYPKASLDLSYFASSINRVKKIFSSVVLSPSSWGVISGCAIFLLTYTDRENNTLQHHVKLSD